MEKECRDIVENFINKYNGIFNNIDLYDLKTLFKNMTSCQGMSDQLACDHLLNQEPFNNYPELVKSLPSIIKE